MCLGESGNGPMKQSRSGVDLNKRRGRRKNLRCDKQRLVLNIPNFVAGETGK